MPGFDGTGPMGMGPLTGGGRGYCSSSGIRTGWKTYGVRTGYRYQPRAYGPQFTNREQEIELLKSQTQELRSTLDEINARINTIATDTK